ncbi:PilN domain-containing protein [Reinekea forsetii]|nr:PilN domain-containing protein [Reinekea forsetii]
MTKQVNLVSADLLPGYGPVQLPVFIWVFLASLICAVLWVLSAYNTRAELTAEQMIWKNSASNQQQALVSYQSLHPEMFNEEQLEQLNVSLTADLNLRRTTLQDLADQLENSIEGFTSPLKQLSDYDVNGLWLETIHLRNGQRSFSLTGFAQTPELIPDYIAQLGNSEFKGISIQQLSVQKEANQRGLWRFSLSNDKQIDMAEVR